jgi:hypothetical protein
MLNRSGVTKERYTAPKQILANVELQASVGCIVPESLGVPVGPRLIAKAGTPIIMSLISRKIPVDDATEMGTANAVLLHDVDVTDGKANGTALYFGVVNLNRVDSDVADKLLNLKDTGHVILIRDQAL